MFASIRIGSLNLFCFSLILADTWLKAQAVFQRQNWQNQCARNAASVPSYGMKSVNSLIWLSLEFGELDFRLVYWSNELNFGCDCTNFENCIGAFYNRKIFIVLNYGVQMNVRPYLNAIFNAIHKQNQLEMWNFWENLVKFLYLYKLRKTNVLITISVNQIETVQQTQIKLICWKN